MLKEYAGWYFRVYVHVRLLRRECSTRGWVDFGWGAWKVVQILKGEKPQCALELWSVNFRVMGDCAVTFTFSKIPHTHSHALPFPLLGISRCWS